MAKKLNKNNYIFVDFDDTLCLHKKTIYCDKYIFANTNPYTNSIPNKKLMDFLIKKSKEKYKIILLTYASSFMLQHKIKWCSNNCSFKFYDYIGLGIDCSKSLYIKKISNKKNIGKIIFIDDNNVDRQNCENIKNLQILSPQYLAARALTKRKELN